MKNRLRLIRDEANLSRAAFGKIIGVSGDVINNLERGRAEIKEPIVKLVCQEFNVSEDWFRTGNGDMRRDPDVGFSDICFEIGINDEKAKAAILKYWKLSDEDKELWWTFMEKFIK